MNTDAATSLVFALLLFCSFALFLLFFVIDFMVLQTKHSWAEEALFWGHRCDEWVISSRQSAQLRFWNNWACFCPWSNLLCLGRSVFWPPRIPCRRGCSPHRKSRKGTFCVISFQKSLDQQCLLLEWCGRVRFQIRHYWGIWNFSAPGLFWKL